MTETCDACKRNSVALSYHRVNLCDQCWRLLDEWLSRCEASTKLGSSRPPLPARLRTLPWTPPLPWRPK